MPSSEKLHAFQFGYNFNSAVTFFILYNTLDVPLSANSVVTLLVNSRGWGFLRVVFSQTRNFTVIAFAGWIYCIKIFSPCPGKQSLPWKFPLRWIYFFTIQDFWATCACPETQTLPWKFSLYWIYFYIQDFWSTCPCHENQSVPWIYSIEYILFIIQDFWATWACPEDSVCPEIFQDRGRPLPPTHRLVRLLTWHNITPLSKKLGGKSFVSAP